VYYFTGEKHDKDKEKAEKERQKQLQKENEEKAAKEVCFHFFRRLY
jgi:hypothetical protein